MRKLLATLWLAMPLTLSGCANPEMGFPHPFQPQGPVAQQRIRAQHFDPYPTDDRGGGDILGGRPEDYHNQIPEPARSRWTLPKFLSRRPVPPPMAVPAPPPQPGVSFPSAAAPAYPQSSYPQGFSTAQSYAPAYPSTGYPPVTVTPQQPQLQPPQQPQANPSIIYAPQAYRPSGT